MNKNLPLLAASALMVACAQPNTFTVSGTAVDFADGDSVFLSTGDEKVDTAVVSGGHFSFQGEADTVRAYRIEVVPGSPDKEIARLTLFLEPGKIDVSIAEESKATGTPLNDSMTVLNESVSTILAKMEDVYGQMADSTLSDSAKEHLETMADSLYTLYMDVQTKAAEANMTNALGIVALRQVAYSLPAEKLDSLLNIVPAAFDADPTVVRYRAAVVNMKATAEGQKFVDLTLRTPDGAEASLSDYVGKGKVVLVDFWASWCGPCRQFAPTLVKIYDEYKDKGFDVVGISLDSKEQAWKGAIESLGLAWPHLSDLKGWQSEAAAKYAVMAIPATVLIDREGVIVARNADEADLEANIAAALGN